jgi:hypothetical protein
MRLYCFDWLEEWEIDAVRNATRPRMQAFKAEAFLFTTFSPYICPFFVAWHCIARSARLTPRVRGERAEEREAE